MNFLGLSIGLFLGSVNAAPIAFSTMVEQAKNGKEEANLVDKLADDIELPRGSTVKSVVVEPNETTDGLEHEFGVVYSNGQQVAIIIDTEYDTELVTDSFDFKVDEKGNLVYACEVRGKMENGKGVAGTGVATKLDVKSKKVRKLFQHELDFWLKGKYRKKSAK